MGCDPFLGVLSHDFTLQVGSEIDVRFCDYVILVLGFWAVISTNSTPRSFKVAGCTGSSSTIICGEINYAI